MKAYVPATMVLPVLLRMSKRAFAPPPPPPPPPPGALLPLMTTLLCEANVGLTATLSRIVYG